MFLVIVPWCAHTTKCVLIENCGRPYRADLNTLTHTDKKTTHANKNCILSGKWRPCLGSPSIHTPKLQKMSITAIDLIASPAASCTIISFRSQNCSGPSKDPSCGRAVRPPCTPQPLPQPRLDSCPLDSLLCAPGSGPRAGTGARKCLLCHAQ